MPYTYTVTRNLDGSGANTWHAGEAVFNTGTTGKGFIDLYSVSGVLSGYGPTIVGNVRTGTTYNNIAPRWAVGNLRSLYDYGSDVYGFAAGNYSTTWVAVDATSGFRVMNSTTQLGQWDTSGNITIGNTSQGNVQITSTGINLRVGATNRISMTTAGVLSINDTAGNAVFTFDGAGYADLARLVHVSGALSALAIGNPPPASATSGTGIWIDRTGLYSLNSGTWQTMILTSDGRLYAGNNRVRIGSDGIRILADNSTTLSFDSPFGNSVSRLYSYNDASDITIWLEALGVSNNKHSHVWLQSSAASATDSTVGMGASVSGGKWGTMSIAVDGVGNTCTGEIRAEDGIQVTGTITLTGSIGVNGGASIGSGIYVGSAAATAPYGTVVTLGDIRCAAGIVAGSGSYDVPTGVVASTDDVRCGGGLYVGSYTTDAAAGCVVATGDARLGGGVAAGSTTQDVSAGNVWYTGALQSYKNSTTYTAYAFVPYGTGYTSTAWDGDTQSSSRTIDLQSVFGVPANIKAVAMYHAAKDATVGASCGWQYSSSGLTIGQVICVVSGIYDTSGVSIVPCDANGDCFYGIAETIDAVYARIYGYFI